MKRPNRTHRKPLKGINYDAERRKKSKVSVVLSIVDAMSAALQIHQVLSSAGISKEQRAIKVLDIALNFSTSISNHFKTQRKRSTFNGQ